MNCKESQRLLHAYLDAELDMAHSLAFEAHLQTCSHCMQTYKNYQRLHMALQGDALTYPAPSSLRKRVQLALPALNYAPRDTSRHLWPWLSTAAILLLLLSAFAFWALSQAHTSPPDESRLAQAVIASHERSLLENHLVDLASSDPNTLKAWFESKLGYSPPVIDLTIQGFSLIGGRLDFLNNQAVAAIVYKCGRHVINLYAWPASQSTDLQTVSLQGYYLTHWTRYGMNCWAVADLNENELQQFAHLINQHIETLV